jgi:paraquat-inducible protein A
MSNNTIQQVHNNEICHECGLVVVIPLLNVKQRATCPRCGYVLTTKHANAVERILAFSITALVFLLASLFFDFLVFQSSGIERSITLLTSVNVLIDNDYAALAVLTVLSIIAIPLCILVSLIYLLLFLKNNKYPPKGVVILTFLLKLIPWSMVEIFLIGTLVSLIKIVSLADIQLGISFYAFILFSVSMIAALLHIDKRELYHLLHSTLDQLTGNKALTIQKKLGSKHHKPYSIQYTWALIITSVVLYIPANIFPIMNARLFGQDDPSTIIGGVILLWHHGSYPIAIIIFIASVLVPVSKIFVLAWLNYSVQKESELLVKERMTLYRVAEFVGRWSMVDVFVVVILVSLVQLGDTMSVLPGYATMAFSGVVVVTMLAAMSFDSKLIYNSKSIYDKSTR